MIAVVHTGGYAVIQVKHRRYIYLKLKGRLHDRAKMARARQKLERFQQFLQRNSELLSVPRRVHRRLWTRRGTDKVFIFNLLRAAVWGPVLGHKKRELVFLTLE